MANKQSFKPEEWTKILESTMLAGMAVSAAEPDGKVPAVGSTVDVASATCAPPSAVFAKKDYQKAFPIVGSRSRADRVGGQPVSVDCRQGDEDPRHDKQTKKLNRGSSDATPIGNYEEVMC